MPEYMLERAELYIIPEPKTKNRTHQTTRWKQVATGDNLEALQKYAETYKGRDNLHLRIIDRGLNIIVKI
ncbi:Hypothetical protein DPCES_0861 [Desulfitobacterium hafniense]|uniref:Uncharacterized protein n=1 Tax=Desulfitobacterium hafniense TaxID=49338 RepID=A0A098AVX7_DESHA|nr:Hypothetical protein DPCES_0861 [Desulfitobacterium hafniense]